MEEKNEYEIIEENDNGKKPFRFENIWTTVLGVLLFSFFITSLYTTLQPKGNIETNSQLLQYKFVALFTEMLTPKLIKINENEDIENPVFKKKNELIEFTDANTRKQIAEQTITMWNEIINNDKNYELKRNAYVNIAVINWQYGNKDKVKDLLDSAKKERKTDDSISDKLIDKISASLLNDKIIGYQVIPANNETELNTSKRNIELITFTEKEIIELEPSPVSAIIMQKLDPRVEMAATFNITAKKTTTYIYATIFLSICGLSFLTIFIASGILWILSMIGTIKITRQEAVYKRVSDDNEPSELNIDADVDIENKDEYPYSPHRIGVGISLFIILLYIVLQGLIIELSTKYGSYLTAYPDRITGISVLYGMIISAVAIIILLWYATKSHHLIAQFFNPAKRPVLQAFAGYAMIIPLVIIISLIQSTSGASQNDTQEIVDVVMNNASDNISKLLFGISIVFLAPIIEETLFRGFLFHALMRRMHWGLAAIISAVCFGLIHAQANTILPITLLGIMLAILTYRNRSIIPAIWAHAIFNGVQILSLYGLLDILK